MSVSKPSKLPIWDINATNIVEPQSTNQSDGWQVDANGIPQKPPFQYHNYMWHTQYKWIEYLDAEKALIGGSNTQKFKVADATLADEALSKGQLLAEIKKVDGVDSGINADLLDGYDSLQSLMYKGDIPDNTDLNTYKTAGLYHQNSNTYASDGTNYPMPNAGMLTVKADGEMVYQTYEVYGSVGRTFTRTYYNNNWYPWKEFFHYGDKATDSNLLDGTQLSAIARKVDYATSTTGGTLKARLDGTTLYLRNDGNNA